MKDEPVDILDEQGSKTGKVLMKSEVHAKSLWHPVVHLWIFNSKGEMLLQKRSHHKLVWPNMWDIAVGGHVAAGDDLEEAVLREAKEEIGIEVDRKALRFVTRTNYEHQMDGWVNRIVIWVYIAKMDFDLSELTLEEEEVSDAKWMKLDDFEAAIDTDDSEVFSPDIKSYCKMIFPKIREQLEQK